MMSDMNLVHVQSAHLSDLTGIQSIARLKAIE